MTIVAIATLMFSLAACSATTTTKTPTINSPVTNNPTPTTQNPTSTTPAVKSFTLAQLAIYNGKNGQPAYIAVSGVVYDVTNAQGWKNGSHQGVNAGQDLTSAIAQAPHGTSVLAGLPVVGNLVY